MKVFAFVAGITVLMVATPAFASAPKFTATCPMGITVKSNGSGKIRINGSKANVKTFNANAWEARHNGISIDIARNGSELIVSYTGKGGNGICQVASSGGSSSSGSDFSGVPSKDQQACLAAVSNKTNNGRVEIMDTFSSEANNTVIVGVGKDRAKWQCLVNNGRVAGVMSMTDEGGL